MMTLESGLLFWGHPVYIHSLGRTYNNNNNNKTTIYKAQ